MTTGAILLWAVVLWLLMMFGLITLLEGLYAAL